MGRQKFLLWLDAENAKPGRFEALGWGQVNAVGRGTSVGRLRRKYNSTIYRIVRAGMIIWEATSGAVYKAKRGVIILSFQKSTKRLGFNRVAVLV